MAKIVREDIPLIPASVGEAADLLERFAVLASKNHAYSLDTETDGLHWYRDNVVMVQIYTPNMKVVLPLAWEDSVLSEADIRVIFAPLLNLKNVVVYAHNAKFDAHFMLNLNVRLKNMVDTYVLARMIDDTQPGGLKHRARTELGMNLVEFKKLFDLRRGKSITDYPVEEVARYGINDAIATYALGNKYTNGGFLENPAYTVGDNPELATLYKKIDFKLTDILFRMERRGILVNVENINKYLNGDGKNPGVIQQLENLERKILKEAAAPFNLNSPKQLMAVLRPRGYKEPSTDVDSLKAHLRKHPDKLISLLMEYRKLAKVKSTYADACMELKDAHDAIHTSFNQGGTDTGRLSSSDPNL